MTKAKLLPEEERDLATARLFDALTDLVRLSVRLVSEYRDEAKVKLGRGR